MSATHDDLRAIAQKRVDEIHAIGASPHQANVTVNAHDILALFAELDKCVQPKKNANAIRQR